MALFEKKEVNVIPGVAECDAKLAKLAGQKREVLHRIGVKYVEHNTAAEAAGTIYAEDMQEIEGIEREVVHTEVKKLALQGLRKCEKCGNVLVLDSLFCNKCGEKLTPLQIEGSPAAGTVCPKCGCAVEAGAAFCVGCGNRIQAS